MCQSEYGVPDKVLQTDLVPDWNAAEVRTGVSVLNVRLYVILCLGYFGFFKRRNRHKPHNYKFCLVMLALEYGGLRSSRYTTISILVSSLNFTPKILFDTLLLYFFYTS